MCLVGIVRKEKDMKKGTGYRESTLRMDKGGMSVFFNVRHTVMSYDAYDGFYERLKKLNGRVVSAVYRIDGMKTGIIFVEYYRPDSARERHNKKKVIQ